VSAPHVHGENALRRLCRGVGVQGPFDCGLRSGQALFAKNAKEWCTRSDNYTAACSGSLSGERAWLGSGMLTITEVPEAFDSIFTSPWN